MIENFYNIAHHQIVFERKPSLDEAFLSVFPENPTERAILANLDWIEGASLGKPRPGHPEGEVIYHILEVLANVETWCAEHPTSPENRSKLRIIALIHDTFKHKVDRKIPEEGENHHAAIARRFAEQIGINENEILTIIETHDDAYLIWRDGNGDREAKEKAVQLVGSLIDRGASPDLYTAFYWCDNHTGDKTPVPYLWFEEIVRSR